MRNVTEPHLVYRSHLICPSPFLSKTLKASSISLSASRDIICFFIISKNSSKSTSPFPREKELTEVSLRIRLTVDSLQVDLS